MKYDLIIKCGNSLGFGWLDTIVELANEGAVLKEGVLHSLRFPHTAYMEIETDEEPIATPFVRVFREDKSEVFIIKEDEVGVNFSLDTAPLTKEELDALEWNEFKAKLKQVGIGGRDRNKMTTEYLKKAESQ